MQLTSADRRILTVLQRDAALSLKDLAEAVSMSASTVWRRVQDLEAAGVITGRVTLVDPEAVGLTVSMLVNVNLASQTKTSREAFEQFVAAHPNIVHCYLVTGQHDYTLIVRMADVPSFEHFLMEDLLARKDVEAAHSQLLLRVSKSTTALPLG